MAVGGSLKVGPGRSLAVEGIDFEEDIAGEEVGCSPVDGLRRLRNSRCWTS